MIKVEVLEDFTLKAFGELKNIERFNPMKKEKGKLYLRDTFECSKEMCEYLTGSNPLNKVVVKVIEVEPKVEVLTDNDEIVEGSIEYSEEPITEPVKATFKPNKKKKKK